MKKDALEQFVDKLIQDKKMDSLEPEVLVEVRNDLLRMAEDKINAYLIKALPKTKIEEFNTVLDSDEEDKIKSFLNSNIPDMDVVIARALVDFKSQYLA